MPAFPVSSLDPFADDFLAAPYPFYAELREAGPVVWLERYELWACARHAEVQAVLSDWQTFSSAAGVGIDDFCRTKPWRPPSLILEADPPLLFLASANRDPRRWNKPERFDVNRRATGHVAFGAGICASARCWRASRPRCS